MLWARPGNLPGRGVGFALPVIGLALPVIGFASPVIGFASPVIGFASPVSGFALPLDGPLSPQNFHCATSRAERFSAGWKWTSATGAGSPGRRDS